MNSGKESGCCCPPKGYNGAWGAGPCPVHMGLRGLTVGAAQQVACEPSHGFDRHGPYTTKPVAVDGMPGRMAKPDQWDDEYERGEIKGHNACLDAVAPVVAQLRAENSELRKFCEDAAKHYEKERDALRSEVERMKGIQPELPPFSPEGEGLPRYGLRWNGPQQPLATPMDEGYWTPWHLADAALDSAGGGDA